MQRCAMDHGWRMRMGMPLRLVVGPRHNSVLARCDGKDTALTMAHHYSHLPNNRKNHPFAITNYLPYIALRFAMVCRVQIGYRRRLRFCRLLSWVN